MKPLVCLRHESPDDLGVGTQVFAQFGIPVRYVDVWVEELPLPSDEMSGLVSLGGEMNADELEEYPFLLTERELLRKAMEMGIPVIGICLGAQILARALGGTVTSAPRREFGFYPIRPTAAAHNDAVLGVYREGDLVFQWHKDTFEIPEGGVVILRGDSVPNQAFRAWHRAWGVQFHPEITREKLEAWLELTRPGLKETWGKTASEILDEADRHLAAQQERSSEMFERFAAVLAS